MFDAILKRIKEEPAIVAGLLNAVITLALLFGLDLTQEQIAAIMGAATAVTAFVVRQQVTPTAKQRRTRPTKVPDSLS
jgi:hypothetical protein